MGHQGMGNQQHGPLCSKKLVLSVKHHSEWLSGKGQADRLAHTLPTRGDRTDGGTQHRDRASLSSSGEQEGGFYPTQTHATARLLVALCSFYFTYIVHIQLSSSIKLLTAPPSSISSKENLPFHQTSPALIMVGEH